MKDPIASSAGVRPAGSKAELARFLRARREALLPSDVGLEARGRRRTPGLRREEVAYLADIGAAWYARLEMGHDVTPSPITLHAISRALRLTIVETEYLFALAELPVPSLSDEARAEPVLPEAIERMIELLDDVGAVVWDRFMTALRWNAIADGMFGYSQCGTPLERNSIVRLFSNPALAGYYGSDFLPLLRSLVGIFRLSYTVGQPPPLAVEVYEVACKYPLFNELWNEQIVSDELFDSSGGPFHRNHPIIGSFTVLTTNLGLRRRSDFTVRVMIPADERSAEQFARLKRLGTPSQRAAISLL